MWVIRKTTIESGEAYYKGSRFVRAGSAEASFTNDPTKAVSFDTQQEGVEFAIDCGMIFCFGVENIQVVKAI